MIRRREEVREKEKRAIPERNRITSAEYRPGTCRRSSIQQNSG